MLGGAWLLLRPGGSALRGKQKWTVAGAKRGPIRSSLPPPEDSRDRSALLAGYRFRPERKWLAERAAPLRFSPLGHEPLGAQLERPGVEPSVALVVDPVEPGLPRCDLIARGQELDTSA